MDELISVVIPNYNKEKYISTCLDSILEQTYRNIEIVVVDDNSTDKSRQILNAYAKKHKQIKLILLNKNIGVSKARNLGARSATGKYLTMLDSDDFYYNKSKLESEINLLKNNKDSGLAYSYRVSVDKYGVPLPLEVDERRYYSGESFFKLLTEADSFNFVQRDYCLLRETFLEAGGYNENMSYYEDYDLLLRLSRNNPLLYTKDTGTGYRIINDGLSNTQKKSEGSPLLTPQQIKYKYLRELSSGHKVMAYICWYIEMDKLVIRVQGRTIKRRVLRRK